MSDAILIALITGGFAILGKVVDLLLTRAKAPEAKPSKPRRRTSTFNPLVSGGILNPATVGFLIAGMIVGIGIVTLMNRQTTTPPGTEVATHDVTVLAKGGQAQIHTTGSDRLRVREQPDFNAQVVTRLDAGTIVTLLDGPRTVGADHWWLLQMPDGTTGWAVESVEGVDTLQPYSP